jgi:hypothetical protein
MALGCGLTSVRGNRGENYENEPLVRQKHTKKKKKYLTLSAYQHFKGTVRETFWRRLFSEINSSGV